MSILFASSDLSDFNHSGAVQSTGGRDTNYSVSSIDVTGAADWIERGFTAIDSLWLSARIAVNVNHYSAGYTPLQIYKGINPVVRLAIVSNFTCKVEFWNGTAWATAISDFPLDFASDSRLSIHVRAGVTGEIRFYKNETRVGTFQGDTSALVGMDGFRLATTNANYTAYWSEIILATHPIVTARLKTLVPAAAGLYSEMAGSVGDINEAIPNDATALVSDVAGQRSTFTVGALPANALVPTHFRMSIRGKRGTTGPQGMGMLLRTNMADHLALVTMFDDATFERRALDFATNPVTGAAWTRAEIDALQVGVQSTD